jgi:hypothetical protein
VHGPTAGESAVASGGLPPHGSATSAGLQAPLAAVTPGLFVLERSATGGLAPPTGEAGSTLFETNETMNITTDHD